MKPRTILWWIAVLAVGFISGLLFGRSGGSGDSASTSNGGDGGHVSLKMASIFPASLDILGDGGVIFTDNVRAASGGRVDIRFFDPGKLVPGLEVFDAVSKGAVDAGWASSGFWIGKLPAGALFTSVPFGPGMSEYLAWMYYGGGLELYQEMYAPHHIHVEPCMMIPPEANGWFREPIDSPDQLKGLKMRFYGLGGKAMQKLGVSVQLLAPGDIYPALERGVLDATEFAMPNMDIKFGFNRIAKHYYFPGWQQPASFAEFIIHIDRWNELSEANQKIIQLACSSNIVRAMSLGEAAQPLVLERLEKDGVKLHYWTEPMISAFRNATNEVMAEEAAKDPFFAKAWESLQAFRKQHRQWATLSRMPQP